MLNRRGDNYADSSYSLLIETTLLWFFICANKRMPFTLFSKLVQDTIFITQQQNTKYGLSYRPET